MRQLARVGKAPQMGLHIVVARNVGKSHRGRRSGWGDQNMAARARPTLSVALSE